MFQGYRQETLDFLWGIRFNNDRTWFQAHKEEYLRCLYEPTAALGEEVYDRFASKRPKLGLDLHISRIYRDARRLHGRGPYKDHLWFSLRPERDAWTHRPVFWFEVAPEGWSYGVGCWNAAPATMAALRRDIDGGGKEIARLARRLARQEVFSLQGQDYARPKGEPGPCWPPGTTRKVCPSAATAPSTTWCVLLSWRTHWWRVLNFFCPTICILIPCAKPAWRT